MAKRDAVPGIGDLLKSARDATGMTQVDASNASRVDRAQLAAYETEERTPSVAVLRRLAKAYGVRTCDLIPELEADKPAKKKTK